MFISSQIFPGSWGCNFLDSKFYFVNRYKTNACIQVPGDVNSCATNIRDNYVVK